MERLDLTEVSAFYTKQKKTGTEKLGRSPRNLARLEERRALKNGGSADRGTINFSGRKSQPQVRGR